VVKTIGKKMIIKEDFLKKLRAAFDLNIYEVKIWTSLLSRGLATAGELSDISNVPRSRSYDVLESLEKKGFVIMKLGKPIRYIAVKPEDIIKRMKDHINDDAKTKVGYLDDVKKESIFTELELLFKQGIQKIDPYAITGAIKGRDNMYSHIKSMLERAEKSVIIQTTSEGFLRKAKRYKTTFKRLNERGVKIKIAAPDALELIKKTEIKNIVQAKAINGTKARFVIIDDKEMLFTIADDKETHESYDTAVWVNTPYFTKAISTMFNKTWQEN
jgi:HTH-type transcriptional regulator, sugar sensing transcriptional regulator